MLGKHILPLYAIGLIFVQSAYSLELENVEIHEDVVMAEKSFVSGMSDKVLPYDPINQVRYEKVIVGKTNKNKNILKKYDYWRYVTVYNVSTSEERIAYLPYFEEACHDNSFFMAEWGESRTIKVTFSSEIKAGELGLSASIGMSIEQGSTFSTSRRIKATDGIRARHYPFKMSDTYEGVTYIQTYNTKTKKYGYLAPSYYDRWTDNYPYPFFLDNQNIGLKVKREVLERCQTEAGSDKAEDQILLMQKAGSTLNPHK